MVTKRSTQDLFVAFFYFLVLCSIWVITTVIRLRLIHIGGAEFLSFKQFIRLAGIEATRLLASFDTPPPFEVWANPVVERARGYSTLAPSRRHLNVADEIFRSCNALNLCDDGYDLVDGGINHGRRLWLTYQFTSLTDYDGRQNYTSVAALISLVRTDQFESEIFFGFGWSRNETLSRFVFDESEDTLKKTVLHKPAWRAVHAATCRPHAG